MVAQGAAQRNPGLTRKTWDQPWKGDGRSVGFPIQHGFPSPLSGLGLIPLDSQGSAARLSPLRSTLGYDPSSSGTGTRTRSAFPSFATEIIAISDHCASLPVLDDRTPEEILGYEEKGVPE